MLSAWDRTSSRSAVRAMRPLKRSAAASAGAVDDLLPVLPLPSPPVLPVGGPNVDLLLAEPAMREDV